MARAKRVATKEPLYPRKVGREISFQEYKNKKSKVLANGGNTSRKSTSGRIGRG